MSGLLFGALIGLVGAVALEIFFGLVSTIAGVFKR